MSSSESESTPRKLVSVRRISRVHTLNSNKTHEVVMVGGWPVVVPKGKFTVNQLVVYFEIGSFLPFHDKRFEPYRSSHVSAKLRGKQGWVVQTVMIDGHVSQGMVLCTDDLSEVRELRLELEESIGDVVDREATVDTGLMDTDFTDDFEVQDWATFYGFDGGRDLGRPPRFLLDGQLERAQNLPDLWKTHGNKEFEITEMLDGTPVTVYKVAENGFKYRELPGLLLDDSNGLFRKRPAVGISIGAHDYEETKESSSWAVVRGQGVIDALAGLGIFDQIVLAGVLCSTETLGNPGGIDGRLFYVHSMYDPRTPRRFDTEKAGQWQRNLNWSFKLVPTISRRMKLSAFAQNMDELMVKAGGDSFVTDRPGRKRKERQPRKRKGLVFRALDRSLNFKAISSDWLLDEARKFRELGEDARRRPGPGDRA